ncbi:MAG: multiple sugar transport system substrate-binding protein [Solirubrobacterales bacterium]|nr:multiple sugar transport system substrate-binding protein [Solirubrobacterales bacterium]
MSGSRRLGSLAIVLVVFLAACGGGGGGGGVASSNSATAKGPIKIWYANNKEEVAWGKAMVDAWNKDHASEQVTGEEIPAGKSSEEVIGASITAGNTPCLIFNTAPAAVPQFKKQGGLVALDDFPDGATYINARTGPRADQYKFTDGKFYQMPWKTNPVMIFYNKSVFAKAGLATDNPPLKTYAEFLQTAKTLVEKGGVQAAIWPAPTSEFYQPWFDFYPLFIAQSGGKPLVVNGEPQFTSPDGLAVADFWRSMYEQRLAPSEPYQGDSFADQKAAMAIVGPWAIAVYGDKVQWGVVPVPTKDGMDPKDIHTFSDEKSIGMYTSCTNRGTAWEFLKFATSKESDGQLLELTGQMPMRADVVAAYPDYFKTHPEYQTFADQASRTVEVPIVPNSVEMWQTFRTAYSESVIFGKTPVEQAFKEAADKIKSLISGS